MDGTACGLKVFMKELFEKDWDYSEHAKFYSYRPNYASKAIDMLMCYVEAKTGDDAYKVVDVGAGTGNLSVLLLEKGLKNITAIEPNDAMREIGEARLKNVKWIKANSTATGLPAEDTNWVTFGSSFNVADRVLVLKETARILKKGGYFTCMWNHRDLNCPTQKTVEDIIVSFIPKYERGVRREDQRPFLEKYATDFENICYIEVDFDVHRTIEEYILAWKSVKNKYWDLATAEGVRLFNTLCDKVKEVLPKEFEIRYTTRAWTMRKKS